MLVPALGRIAQPAACTHPSTVVYTLEGSHLKRARSTPFADLWPKAVAVGQDGYTLEFSYKHDPDEDVPDYFHSEHPVKYYSTRSQAKLNINRIAKNKNIHLVKYHTKAERQSSQDQDFI